VIEISRPINDQCLFFANKLQSARKSAPETNKRVIITGAAGQDGLLLGRMLAKSQNIVLGIVIAVIVYWLYDITTPDQCKVAIENMSEWCKDLRYP
jgi:hypothetical protein